VCDVIQKTQAATYQWIHNADEQILNLHVVPPSEFMQ
jgi:hypothetical protein